MSAVKQIEVKVDHLKDLVLIDSRDSVWLVVHIRWFDLATILFWMLLPHDRRARVKLKIQADTEPDVITEVTVNAYRLATKHMRIRGAIRA